MDKISECETEITILCSDPYNKSTPSDQLWANVTKCPILEAISFSYSALSLMLPNITHFPPNISKIKLMSLQDPQILVNALSKSNSLHTIDLTHLQLQENIYFLVEPVLNCASLQCLKLGGNHIGEYGAVDIANIIKKTRTISEIELWGNDITSKGFIKICLALCKNKSVRTVDFDTNSITNDQLKIFGQMLIVNKTLKSVSLNNNMITTRGVYAFSPYLLKSSAISRISLNTNLISNRGAYKLVKCVSKLSRHFCLDLRYNNHVTNRGARKIIKKIGESSINCKITNGRIDSILIAQIETYNS